MDNCKIVNDRWKFVDLNSCDHWRGPERAVRVAAREQKSEIRMFYGEIGARDSRGRDDEALGI